MLNNYLKVLLRRAANDKLYILTVLFGLTTAFTICLLIYLYIFDEKTYDRFHDKADRIMRVAFTGSNEGKPFRSYYTPPNTTALFETLPEVEASARIHKFDPEVRRGDNLIKETELIFATESFFDIFNYTFLEGDPATALEKKYSIVLTRNRAERYFGNESALGKTLFLSKEGAYLDQPFEVTGVIEDIPKNTSYIYDMILSHQSRRGHMGGDLSQTWAATFILLRPDASYESIYTKLPAINDDYFESQGMSEREEYLGFVAQPLLDVHLSPPLDLEWIPGGAGGNRTYLIFLIATGLGILLIASVNYVNLTMARSIGQLKSFGVRKAIGALRGQLLGLQFLESIGIMFISLILAIPLTLLGIPLLNKFISNEILPQYLVQWPLIAGVLISVAVIGVLAGAYPAYFISKHSAVVGLYGHTQGKEKGALRNSLVVVQYALSTILLIFSVHMYFQLQYMKVKDLGFDRESLLVIDRVEQLGTNQDAFIKDLTSHGSILNAGLSRTYPGRQWGTWKEAFYDSPGALASAGEGNTTDVFSMRVFLAGPNLASTMGMEFLEGRDLIPGHTPDSSGIIVNQKAIESFGWSNPIGKQLYRQEMEMYVDEAGEQKTRASSRAYTIVGIVEDFNYFSLETPIEPLVMMSNLRGATLHCILVRMTPNTLDKVVADIKTSWEKFLPNSLMSHYVLDHELDALYKSHTNFGSLINIFTLFSILIAFLGMLSLASYAAVRRFREIGIRKALGASVNDIVVLLLKKTVLLVCLACLIGLPLGYLVTRRWLDNFAYRIEIEWHVLIVVMAAMLCIAMLSTFSQAFRAAHADPVDSIREE